MNKTKLLKIVGVIMALPLIAIIAVTGIYLVYAVLRETTVALIMMPYEYKLALAVSVLAFLGGILYALGDSLAQQKKNEEPNEN